MGRGVSNSHLTKGKWRFKTKREWQQWIDTLEESTVRDMSIEVSFTPNPRTFQQNSALHLWCSLQGSAMNEAGFEQRAFFEAARNGYDVPWRTITVKENIWRPVQVAMKKPKSTTEVNKLELSDVYDTVCRALGGIGAPIVPFPSKGL